jgi:hypothetical protein
MRIWLLLLICAALGVSAAMALWPRRVLAIAASNKLWRNYLQKVLCLSPNFLASSRAAGLVRLQGAIGVAFALLAMFAWVKG